MSEARPKFKKMDPTEKTDKIFWKVEKPFFAEFFILAVPKITEIFIENNWAEITKT